MPDLERIQAAARAWNAIYLSLNTPLYHVDLGVGKCHDGILDARNKKRAKRRAEDLVVAQIEVVVQDVFELSIKRKARDGILRALRVLAKVEVEADRS